MTARTLPLVLACLTLAAHAEPPVSSGVLVANRWPPPRVQIPPTAIHWRGDPTIKAAFDGDPKTAWCPTNLGKEPPTLQLRIDGDRRILGFGMIATHGASVAIAKQYARPEKVRLETDAGSVPWTFDDPVIRADPPEMRGRKHWEVPEMAPLEALRLMTKVQLGRTTPTTRDDHLLAPIVTSQFRLVIESTYTGNKYPRVCISEIEILEAPPETKQP